MAESIGDVLAGNPISLLSVHLGDQVPVGVPSLNSLTDLTFGGYSPGRFASGYAVEDANGFSFLQGAVSFTCLDSEGFSASCLWIVSEATGSPVLLAYSPLANGSVTIPNSGTVQLNLLLAVFEVPSGF